jgi:hypothetical protein
MKFKLRDYLLFAFIIICLVFLWGSDFFLKHINFKMGIVIITICLIAMLVYLFMDIKDKRYSTKKYIIITDVVELIAYLAICYFGLEPIDSSNIDLFVKREGDFILISLVMVLMMALKSILKSQRFKKNVDGINDL